jgi:energy-coupling factor transporter transmembrane protein EcfT
MNELSPHIPDLDLITLYSEKGTTLFSRISPWTKALMLVLIILFVSIEKSLILAVCLYLIVFALYRLSGMPIKKLFQWYMMPFIFVLCASHIYPDGILDFTLEGNHLSCVIILASILVATALIYVKYRV